MTEQIALEPCPFCGGEVDIDAPTRKERMVFCKQCYASICEDAMPAAIAAWNRRAESAEVSALRASHAQLKAALQAIVDLDDGDSPDLWHYEDEFNAGRQALSIAEDLT